MNIQIFHVRVIPQSGPLIKKDAFLKETRPIAEYQNGDLSFAF